MANPVLGEVARDPRWLPHTYDLAGVNLTFVNVPPEARADLMFLSDEHFQGRFPKAAFPASGVESELAGRVVPIHFIFHTSFCCSTLLAKALDIPGVSQSLQEPDVLIHLANRLVHADDSGNRQRLELVLKLLERDPGQGEAVVVKPTNFANRLIEPVLAARPASRAVLLYSDLQTFLASLVKRGLWGRRFGRQLYVQLASWVPVDFGLGTAELFELTDLQVTGLAWLMQIAHFNAVARSFGRERIMLLQGAELTAEPAAVLQRVQTFFGLDLDAAKVAEIAAGPIFASHSKFAGVGYGPEQRARDHETIAKAHAEELAMVIQWVEAVANRLELPLRPQL